MLFDKKASLLSLEKIKRSQFGWVETKSLWIHAEHQNKTNLFSKVGIAARSMLFSMNPQEISLHQAIRWRGQHYFLTSIDKKSPVEMEITAAFVDIRQCTAIRYGEKKGPAKSSIPVKKMVAKFPAALTEKYIGFTQNVPMAQTTVTYVLVTPKVIDLEVSDLVSVGGREKYTVLACHVLDAYKNEYEITRKEDA